MIFLSIIICTYNREKLLKNCLDELFKQMPPYVDSTEIIVVDNNCTDGTASMIQQYCELYPWLKYMHEEKQGLSNARNCGAKAAQGAYLCYLDDDGKPSEKYLAWVHFMLNKHKPDIAGGPVYPYYTTPKPKWFRDEFEIRKHSQSSVMSKKCSISGGNFIIRAILLSELGMFSPEYGMVGNKTRLGDEKALLIRYRSTVPVKEQRVYYSLECFIYHHVPQYKMNVFYFLKRGFFSGVSLVQIKKKTMRDVPGFAGEAVKILFTDFIPMLLTGARTNDHPVLALQRMALNFGKIIEAVRRGVISQSEKGEK